MIKMAYLKTKFESFNQDWETPSSIFKPLNDEFHFTLDVCANSKNAKCKNYFSKEQNGLKQRWKGICWMNPPFKEVGKWIKKAYEESKKEAVVVCLVASRTNTNWWHEYCMKGEIRFIRGRPKFNENKYGLPQPLAIVIFHNQKTP